MFEDIDKIIDKYFNWVIDSQNYCLNKVYSYSYNIKTFICTSKICFILGICSMILYMGTQSDIFLGTCTVCILGLFISMFLPTLFKWITSVKHLTIFLTIINIIVVLCITYVIIKQQNILFYPLFIIVYVILWLIQSSIALSSVSRVSNSIVGAFTTVMFTVFTSILQILPSTHTFGLPNEMVSTLNDIGYSVIQVLQIPITLFLPFIGASAFSLAILEVKQYWLVKNNIEEITITEFNEDIENLLSKINIEQGISKIDIMYMIIPIAICLIVSIFIKLVLK